MTAFSDIEWGFFFVSSQPRYSCRVVYDKKAQRVYASSDFGDEDEIPDDLDWDHCVEIPHKNDLDLGRELVFEFIEQTVPDEYNRVRGFFSGPGAYARFKDFLEYKGLLAEWYQFEKDATEQALKKWCTENGISI